MVGLLQFSRAKAAVAVNLAGFETELRGKPQVQVKTLTFQTPVRKNLSSAPSGLLFGQLRLSLLGVTLPYLAALTTAQNPQIITLNILVAFKAQKCEMYAGIVYTWVPPMFVVPEGQGQCQEPPAATLYSMLGF